MNARWEIYIKNHKALGKQRLDEFIEEHDITIDKAIDIACVEDQLLLAYAIQELAEVKYELKKLKKTTKKVIDNE